MNDKSTGPTPNIPPSPPSAPGDQRWQARVLPNEQHNDKIDPDKPVIRWMSDRPTIGMREFQQVDHLILSSNADTFVAAHIGLGLDGCRHTGERELMKLSSELQAYAQVMRNTLTPEVMVKLEAMIARLQAAHVGSDAPKVGDMVPPVLFIREDGGIASLKQFLELGPVILIFYRGRWCPFCDLQLRAFDRSAHHIKAAGAQIIAVSPQTVEELAKQAGEARLSFEIYSDARNAAARAFNLVWASTIEEQELSKGWDVDLSRINGDDLWELPATALFVIDRSGIVRWRQIDVDFTKRAEPEDVLAALQTLPPS